MDVDKMFAGMATAQMFGKGIFMGEGRFGVRTKLIKLNEGHKGKSFIVEFEVLSSTNEKHAIGSSGSWVVKMDKPNAFSDIKGFVAALIGMDPKSIRKPEEDPATHETLAKYAKAACDADFAKKIGEEPDFLIGVDLNLETVLKKTLAGKDFTVHNWSPAEEAAA